MLEKFIEYLEEQVKNHSIYVWGAQGQTGGQVTSAWITAREKTSSSKASVQKANARRAIAYWKKQVIAGYGDRLRAFDCSGLGVWALQQMGVIKIDMTANGMMGKCEKLVRAALKRGDWVFRVDSKGKAYHVGYVVDDCLNVIEAKGRDDGVVMRALGASGKSYWNAYGRPVYFKAEIEAEEGDDEMKKIKCKAVKKIKPLYDKTGAVERGRYIAKGDICSVTNVMTDGLLIAVEYPTKAGTRTAYVNSTVFFRGV